MWQIMTRDIYGGMVVLALVIFLGLTFFPSTQAEPNYSSSNSRDYFMESPKDISVEPNLSPQELRQSVSKYDHLIRAACRKYSLDPALVKAVMHAESLFDPRAISPRGAVGLMQLDPTTVRELGISDPFNPKINIYGGVRYLRDLLDSFEGDKELALAAYNAGPSRVVRHKGIPPYKDTQKYIVRVFRYFSHYQKDSLS
jgi:soluble lytic murein transglycosylase-like protein